MNYQNMLCFLIKYFSFPYAWRVRGERILAELDKKRANIFDIRTSGYNFSCCNFLSGSEDRNFQHFFDFIDIVEF